MGKFFALLAFVGKPHVSDGFPSQRHRNTDFNVFFCVNRWINNRVTGDLHDDVIKWKHLPRYWTSVRGLHRTRVNSGHKGQWCGALMFSLICAWINGWVYNREAGDLWHHRAHYDVNLNDVMVLIVPPLYWFKANAYSCPTSLYLN